MATETSRGWLQLEDLVVTASELTDMMAADPVAHVLQGQNQDLGREMKGIAKRGRLEGWTTPQYRDELDKIIARERQRLRSGKTGLNKNQRPWAED